MQHQKKHTSPYLLLGTMSVLSFAAMYVLMYAMVDRPTHVYVNINQLYMAGLMTAPMVVFELMLMAHMYQDKKINRILFVASILGAFVMWYGIRQQAGVNDAQFLRSMIPHHSGAILMCREAMITNPEIKDLCREITESQQREIDRMQSLLIVK